MKRGALALRALWTAALIILTSWVVRAASGDQPRGLTFVGSLTAEQGAEEPVDLTFRFTRAGGVVCSPVIRDVKPEARTGNVHLTIPLDECGGVFDGSDVVVEVLVGNDTVITEQPMNAIPRAKYAGMRGSPQCPAGYDRELGTGEVMVCRRERDEIVKVGVGAAAFWIDRFEAGVFADSGATGQQYGTSADDYPANFPDDGDYSSPLFAVSASGVMPSRFVTWFQANEACRAMGKRLPTLAEWHRAVRGTPDRGESSGASAACVTAFDRPLVSGSRTACRSAWGAEDMIGNAAEWTQLWQSTLGDASSAPQSHGERHADGTWNIVSQTLLGPAERELGPAIAVRGGSYLDRLAAGVFALDFRHGPHWSGSEVGFRCVVPR